jgi:hypothetical protein
MYHANRFNNFSSSHMGGYSSTPLSLEQIERYAPSVFAQDRHESRSNRYTYIPTSQVLQGLMAEGFNVYSVMQGNSRIPGKADFTKHMLKLRKQDNVSADTFEIILINSHDGTSAYKLISGYYRLVCSNGMVSYRDDCKLSIPHRGDIVRDVIEGAYTILDTQREIAESVNQLKAIQLLPNEARAFASAALELKYPSEINEETQKVTQTAPIVAEQLLRPRRYDDKSSDLWTQFNVIQENMIKGGQQGRSANGRRASTRAVKSIDNNVNLNRALWMLADRMAELKAA